MAHLTTWIVSGTKRIDCFYSGVKEQFNVISKTDTSFIVMINYNPILVACPSSRMSGCEVICGAFNLQKEFSTSGELIVELNRLKGIIKSETSYYDSEFDPFGILTR